MTGHLDISDPAAAEIVCRALSLDMTSDPSRASVRLGTVKLADGRSIEAHVIHAVDAVITDGRHVVMIDRRNEPGKGRPALPGGFIDPLPDGAAEGSGAAARREAMEEVGLDLSGVEPVLVGGRNGNRPHDIRFAYNDGLEKAYGVAKGDVFLVSTQAVRFDVPNLRHATLTAGDDAADDSARLVAIDSLTPENVGVSDHFDMIMAALGRDALIRR